MGEGRSFLIRVVLSVLAGNTCNINETVYRQATCISNKCMSMAVSAMNSEK